MQSGCRDLNPGPLDPQSSALTKLRHSPLLGSPDTNRTGPTRKGQLLAPLEGGFRTDRYEILPETDGGVATGCPVAAPN